MVRRLSMVRRSYSKLILWLHDGTMAIAGSGTRGTSPSASRSSPPLQG